MSIEVNDDTFIIKPIEKKPREGWDEQFRTANSLSDTEGLIGDFRNQFDEDEWTW